VTATTPGADTLEQQILSRPLVEQGPVREFLANHPVGEGAPIAVVIPAYNEEPTVASVVRGIPREIGGKAVEVIVVVDGSDDRTADEARGAGALVCDVPANRGQGSIFMLGYWLADKRGAEFIATTDADGQYDQSELDRVLEPLLSGRADYVNGSRRLGTELTTDATRHAGVILFGAVLSVLMRQRITDPAAGMRAFRTAVTRTVKLEQPQYQNSELLIATRMNGFKIVEVATTMRDRPDGATLTKKGRNLHYALRFSGAMLGTFIRELTAGRTGLRRAKTSCLK
jgi:glycosyltransferase involved in cell wall biosynthesis